MITLNDFSNKDNFYQEYNFKNGIQSCDIGFVRYYGNNPLLLFIRNKICKITNGIFNHSFIVGKSSDIIEAEFTGVKINKFIKYVQEKSGVLIFRYNNLPRNLKKSILSFAYSQVGKKYGYMELLSFIFKTKISDDTTYYCSELVNECYKKSNITISSKPIVSPNDLFNDIIKNNNFILTDKKNLNTSLILPTTPTNIFS